MVKFLINRPVAVFMATFAFLLLGIVASLQIPTALMPDIAIPEITVQLVYPNNTARELETNVVRPLRNQLLQVANLKDIETETRDGFATLKLVFEYGTNTDYAFIETNEKVDGALNYLPRDLDRPKVIKASATDIPILNLTVSIKDDYSDERFLELSEFTETILKKRIEQLPDIAMADMSGQTKAEIVVTPYKNKIQSLGIDNNKLVEAIKQNNFELGNLIVQNGIYQYNFKFSNPLRTKKDIENIYLNIHDKLFQLKDLAKISLEPQLDRGLVYNNGRRAVVLAIIKQADARVYDLKEALEELTLSFQEDYPNLEFSTNQDQTQLLKLSIDNLKSSLWIGSVLAILIMFFFLKDVKLPLIIGISIPVSLIVSLLFMYAFGLSINIISLSGLILGVGMMIDNAIIVIDNITQKLESGLNLFDACVEGTNEIITPLISSVLTTCSVFLPLLFLSGITGALFYDQAIAVSIGLGSSLIVSIVLIPVIYKQLKNKNFKFEKWLQFNAKTQRIENWYEKGYYFFFGRKWIIYGISILSIVVAVILFQTMEYSQLPEINQNETIATIDWNETITVNENQKRIQTILKDISNIKTQFSQVGEQQFLLQRENTKSFSEASVYLKANSISELETIKETIQQQIQTIHPNSNIYFEAPKTIFQYIFGTNKSKLIAQVHSKASLEVPVENKLVDVTNLLADKTISEIPLKQTASIQIIDENVLLYDVSYDDLINELKTAFNQNFIDNLKTAQKFIPIKLNYDNVAFENAINQLFVKNKNEVYIPVKNLIKVNTIQQYKTITANRSGEYLGFDINTKNNIESEIETIQNAFQESKDFNVRFSGSWLELKSLNSQLIIVIIVALLLLYFIMAAQFESLWQPLIILLEIPIDIGGALLLLWLFGGTINVMAVIGIVVMSGVIINDSILKIHTINTLRQQGLKIEDAIKKGGKLRLKPILMTSLTTILALLPFLFMNGLGAELQKPLALTVIGGMLIGTFISLYFIPLMYYTFSKKTSNEIYLNLLLILITVSVKAQDKWSLEDCINHAKEHSVEVVKQKFQNKSINEDVTIAKGSYYPNASFSATQGYSLGNSFNISTGVGQLESRFNSFSLSSSINIFNGFSNKYKLQQARLSVEKGEVDLEKLKLDISLTITNQYLQVLFNKEILVLAKKQKEISEKEVNRLEQLFKSALNSKSEFLEMKSVFITDNKEVLVAENNLKNSLLELQAMLDVKTLKDFDVDAIDIKDFEYNKTILGPEKIYEEALGVNPLIKSTEYAIDINEKDYKIAKADLYPSIDFNYSYGSSYYHLQGRDDVVFNSVTNQFEDNGFLVQLDNNRTHFLGFSLNVPIFNRFQTKSNIDKAKVQLDIDKVELENQKKELENKVEIAYNDVITAKVTLEALEVAMESQEEAFNIVQNKYQKALMTSYEFLESKAKYILVESELIRAKYDYVFKIKVLEYYKS